MSRFSTWWRSVKQDRTDVLALAVAVNLMFFSSLSLGFLNRLADDTTHRRGQGVDFYAVYQAGRNVLDGVSVYAEKPEHFVVPYDYPYRYHPIVALSIGLASNAVTPAVAYTLWILIQELLLAANVILTRRLFSDPKKANLVSAIWLLFFPFYLELYMGQFSFLMASLVFWMVLLWTKGSSAAGDRLWVGSLLIKSNTGVLVPVLLKIRRWRVVLAAAGIVSVISLPYFLAFQGSAQAFAGNLTEPLTVPTIAGNQGATALVAIAWLRLAGLWPGSIFQVTKQLDELNAALVLPVAAWMFAVIVVALVVSVRARREDWVELMVLWMVVYFLFYKHVWEHQYVMALPAFVILVWRRSFSEVSRRLSTWVVGVSLALAALPTAFLLLDKEKVMIDPEYYWSTAESLLFHAPKPLGMILLFVGLSVALWRAATLPPREAMNITSTGKNQ